MDSEVGLQYSSETKLEFSSRILVSKKSTYCFDNLRENLEDDFIWDSLL